MKEAEVFIDPDGELPTDPRVLKGANKLRETNEGLSLVNAVYMSAAILKTQSDKNIRV